MNRVFVATALCILAQASSSATAFAQSRDDGPAPPTDAPSGDTPPAPAPVPADPPAPPSLPPAATPAPAADSPETVAPPAQDSSSAAEALDIADIDLEDLLRIDIAAGESGSFGSRMSSRDARIYVHAFGIVEANNFEKAPFAFELEYFNLIVGGAVGKRITGEVQLEATENGEDVFVKYGQIDLSLVEGKAILRAGKFLAPIGVFNEYLYPEYLNKMVFPPDANRLLLPRGLTGVGAQVRGKVGIGEGRDVNYAVFVSNNPLDKEEAAVGGMEEGEEEEDSFVSTPGEDEISAKTFGGRLGIKLDGLNTGVSTFIGTYDAEEDNLLYVGNVDAAYQTAKLAVRSEFMFVHKSGDESQSRTGFFLQAAYKVLDQLEPAAQYDRIDGADEEQENRQNFTLGLNYYPYPEDTPNLVGKINGVVTTKGEGDSEKALLLQLALGF